MRFYKGVMIGHSALGAALDRRDDKAAKALFSDTSARYAALYPADDRAWFASAAARFQCQPPSGTQLPPALASMGYTIDSLEKDNPYNQWQQE
jgi:hypothetical protein